MSLRNIVSKNLSFNLRYPSNGLLKSVHGLELSHLDDDTLQGIVMSSESMPMDPLGVRVGTAKEIFPIQVALMTLTIPPSAFEEFGAIS